MGIDLAQRPRACGRLLFAGTLKRSEDPKSITGRYFELENCESRYRISGTTEWKILRLFGATLHNLQNVDADSAGALTWLLCQRRKSRWYMTF